MEEQNQVIFEATKDMVERGDISLAIAAIEGLHPRDASEVLSNLDIESEAEILKRMKTEKAARIILEMEEEHQVDLASRLKTTHLVDLVRKMPVDEAVDLLGDISVEQREKLLRLFGSEEVQELKELLSYGDRTAGGLMTTDYVSVPADMRAGEVIDYIRQVPPETETIYYIYVVGRDGKLIGVISLRELIASPVDRKAGEMAERDIISVEPQEAQEKVAEIISKYELLAVPVVNGEGRILGIVTEDDVMDVVEEEADEKIMRLAGAVGLPEGYGLWQDLARRIPWLLVVVVVEILLCGGILKLGSPVWENFKVLVFFTPLLITMSGNIALQSSSVMNHMLSTEMRSSSSTFKIIGWEVLGALAVGLAAGGLVQLLSLFLDLPSSVGIIVSLALCITVILAAVVGSALPLVFRLFKREPGVMPRPFVGVVMDVVSLAIYLGIGRIFS
ncbi:MAG: magnesium transporter [Actinomycetota bacterium]|nr:magnesium transporter [Actinomycetota bacterium]